MSTVPSLGPIPALDLIPNRRYCNPVCHDLHSVLTLASWCCGLAPLVCMHSGCPMHQWVQPSLPPDWPIPSSHTHWRKQHPNKGTPKVTLLGSLPVPRLVFDSEYYPRSHVCWPVPWHSLAWPASSPDTHWWVVWPSPTSLHPFQLSPCESHMCYSLDQPDLPPDLALMRLGGCHNLVWPIPYPFWLLQIPVGAAS